MRVVGLREGEVAPDRQIGRTRCLLDLELSEHRGERRVDGRQVTDTKGEVVEHCRLDSRVRSAVRVFRICLGRDLAALE